MHGIVLTQSRLGKICMFVQQPILQIITHGFSAGGGIQKSSQNYGIQQEGMILIQKRIRGHVKVVTEIGITLSNCDQADAPHLGSVDLTASQGCGVRMEKLNNILIAVNICGCLQSYAAEDELVGKVIGMLFGDSCQPVHKFSGRKQE